jgi:hypothetical protein
VYIAPDDTNTGAVSHRGSSRTCSRGFLRTGRREAAAGGDHGQPGAGTGRSAVLTRTLGRPTARHPANIDVTSLLRRNADRDGGGGVGGGRSGLVWAVRRAGRAAGRRRLANRGSSHLGIGRHNGDPRFCGERLEILPGRRSRCARVAQVFGARRALQGLTFSLRAGRFWGSWARTARAGRRRSGSSRPCWNSTNQRGSSGGMFAVRVG